MRLRRLLEFSLFLLGIDVQGFKIVSRNEWGEALSALRFFAYFSVCLVHVVGDVSIVNQEYKNLADLMALRSWSIPSFFIISGYLLRLGGGGKILKRIKGVFFPFLLAFVLLFALNIIIASKGIASAFVDSFFSWLWFPFFYALIYTLVGLGVRLGMEKYIDLILLSIGFLLLFVLFVVVDCGLEFYDDYFSWVIFRFAYACTCMSVGMIAYRFNPILVPPLVFLVFCFLLGSFMVFQVNLPLVNLSGRLLMALSLLYGFCQIRVSGVNLLYKEISGGDRRVFYYAYLIHGFVYYYLILAIDKYLLCNNLAPCVSSSVLLYDWKIYFSIFFKFIFVSFFSLFLSFVFVHRNNYSRAV